jgi:hypothetical protein
MSKKVKWEKCGDCSKTSHFAIIEDGEPVFFCEDCLIDFVNTFANIWGIEFLKNSYPIFYRKKGHKTIYTDFDSMLDEKVQFT